MKIEFENKSYIEVAKSKSPNKMIITLAAREQNGKSVIAHSVEITEEQFKELIRV